MYDQDEFSQWKEEIKEADITDLIDELGLPRRKNAFICPNPEHNDSHIGSCVIKDGNKFHCFACGAFGDNISLIQMYAEKYEHQQINMVEACNRVAAMAGLRQSESLEDSKGGPARPYTLKQLKLLGLQGGNYLDITCASETRRPESRDKEQYSDGLYLYGDTIKESLDDLYDEDQTGFNYMVIGKLCSKLSYLINLYKEKVYEGLDQSYKRDLEDKIETLIPLARYYEGVAPGYGYDLTFISGYEKQPDTFSQRFSFDYLMGA